MITMRKVSFKLIEKFIELVRENACLYDPKDPAYKDSVTVSDVWDSLAKQMAVPTLTGDDWKKKWRNQRDVYVKKMRIIMSKKSTNLEVQRAARWANLEQMSFIKYRCEIDEDDCRRSDDDGTTNDEAAGAGADMCNEDGGDAYMLEEDGSVTLSALPQPITSLLNVKRELEDNDDATENYEVENGIMEGDRNGFDVASFRERLKQQAAHKRVKRDDLDLFFESCELRMKRLPLQTRSFVQYQISQLLFNAENPDMSPVPIMPLPQHQPKKDRISPALKNEAEDCG